MLFQGERETAYKKKKKVKKKKKRERERERERKDTHQPSHGSRAAVCD